MACESLPGYDSDPFSSTPPPPPPPPSKKFGRWAKDCPNKTPQKSQASCPGSPSSPSPYLPVVRCPCGRGNSKVWTSKTKKNPGRKFYTCPVDHRTSGRCGFFKWTDEIVARFKPPTCPCGAGTCSLNIESSGPDRNRWYYACRIKKNHGACQFFQWADSEVNNVLNIHGDESKGCSAIRSLFAGHQALIVNSELCKEDNQSSDIELELAMAESVENSPNSSMASLMAGTALQVSPLVPKSESPCQEPEFSLRISAAGHTNIEGTSPFDPVIEDVGDIEGLTILTDSSSNEDESCMQQGPLVRSPGEDAERPNSVFKEPTAIKIVVERDTSKLALKTFGQGLLDFLQSMDQTQHEKMLVVAEATFNTLHHLSIDHASFSKAVREYIECKSKLGGIEESMGKDFSSEDFLGHYNEKKTKFDEVSQFHVEAVSDYEASENRLQSLRREVSHVKNMLLQLEKQLSFCEAETLRCKSRVTDISNVRSELERSLDAACEKIELEHERDLVIDAANAALENARIQLLQ